MQTNRNEFLRLMAAAALLRPASAQKSGTPPESNEPFAIRVMEDCGAALRLALCYIGDRVGIFKAMASSGPVTAPDLARKTQLNPRMLREWLNGLVAARYIEYHPANKTYLLTKEHTEVLANEESSPICGMFQLIGSLVSAAPKVAKAFQTGKPVAADEFTSDLYLGGHRATAPDFKHQLVQTWIPLMPRVQETLVAGGAAADVGCGTGLASIMLAKAFPKSRFAGYDPFRPSIQIARELARKEGVGDRVQFVAADASKLPHSQFDLVTIFGSVHHFSDPVTVLKECRQALKASGTCFILDTDLSLNPEDNINLFGRLAYPITTLYCLQDSLAGNGAGVGAEFNAKILKDFAAKSGFSKCSKLPGSAPMKAYYSLEA